MTRIEILEKTVAFFGYRAIGHSGYSEQGSDIVLLQPYQQHYK